LARKHFVIFQPTGKTTRALKNNHHRPDVEFLCKIIVFFISVIFFSPALGKFAAVPVEG